MRRLMAVSLMSVALTSCGGEISNGASEANASTNMAMAADRQENMRDSEVPTFEGDGPYAGVMVAPDGSLVEVRYQEVGGLAVVGGDMIVATHEEMQRRMSLLSDLRDGDIQSDALNQGQKQALERLAQRANRAGEALLAPQFSRQIRVTLGWGTSGNTWPTRVIPYVIDPSIPPGPRRTEIANGVALWNQQSAITLRPAAQLSPGDLARSAVLVFVDHSAPDDQFACASWVGYEPTNGRQEVALNPDCLSGNIAHEIGHAVGLYHEHQRTDRDSLLAVNSNIPADSHNYGTLNGRHLSGHDLCSIMHYGPRTTRQPWFTLTIAGQQGYQSCLQGLAPECRRAEPGQRCQLSPGDIASLQSLYR